MTHPSRLSDIHTDGGPAFPRPLTPAGSSQWVGGGASWPFSDAQSGMSLRDYFAGQALQGMSASPELMVIVSSGGILDGTAFERMSAKAYELADAMIAHRNKPT